MPYKSIVPQYTEFVLSKESKDEKNTNLRSEDNFLNYMYRLKEGEGYSQYITDGSRWAKGTVASSDMEEMTPTDSIQLFLAEGAAFRKVGTETLEGGDAVKYENTLKGAQLVEALDNVQLLDSISSMSEDQQSKIRSDLGKNLKGLTVHIWVDEATGYPVRYEMDRCV